MLFNQGEERFERATYYDWGAGAVGSDGTHFHPRALSAADLDQDGRIDLAIPSGNGASLLFNGACVR